MTPINMKTREIGRAKKIAKLPCEIRSDWRREFSKSGLNTSAKIRGAASQSNLRMRYSIPPKITMMSTSWILLLTLYAPMRQMRMMGGIESCKVS